MTRMIETSGRGDGNSKLREKHTTPLISLKVCDCMSTSMNLENAGDDEILGAICENTKVTVFFFWLFVSLSDLICSSSG